VVLSLSLWHLPSWEGHNLTPKVLTLTPYTAHRHSFHRHGYNLQHHVDPNCPSQAKYLQFLHIVLKTTFFNFHSMTCQSPSSMSHHPTMACKLSCSGWNGLPWPLQPVCIQLADNTALIGAPTQPLLLLISHLKTDPNRLEHWLQDYRNATNIKKTERFFTKTVRCFWMLRLWSAITMGQTWHEPWHSATLVSTHQLGAEALPLTEMFMHCST